MSADTQRPAPSKIISDIETLKVYFDPVRKRILQEMGTQPKSIQEIARALAIPFTRLYYHIHLLEKHGLVEHVETRQGAGVIEEKFYQVTAYLFLVDRSLMTMGTPQGDETFETILSIVLDETKQDIRNSVAAGVIDTAVQMPHPNAMRLLRHIYRIRPEHAIEFQAKVTELMKAYTDLENEGGDERRSYGVIFALYPSVFTDAGTTAEEFDGETPTEDIR